MYSKLFQQIALIILAIVFSIALMFSFTELPRLLDSVLGQQYAFPGVDHGGSDVGAVVSETYISSLHLRIIGYASLGLVILMIVLGFITKKTGWAWAGAFIIFLPVFGQFALSMFFLAGLGMLRVGWLPFWDISFQVLDLGKVAFLPYELLMWIFRQFNYWAQLELAWFFMGVGAFLFTWGVLVWMQSRFIKKGVATSWIYRISRHPQYLGWIIWTYGLVIYAPLINQMKKSWGMSSTLPWLLMTMIIIGICMLEEIKMRQQYGSEYDRYRDRTPFLFPLPGWLKKIIKYPMWLIIRKKRPEKKREVAAVITIYTVLLIIISMLWIDFGNRHTFPLTEGRREARAIELANDIENTTMRREIVFKVDDLAKLGQAAVVPLIGLLDSEDPNIQEHAAKALGELGDTTAIKPLYNLLGHPWDNVRGNALGSIVELGDRNIIPHLYKMLNAESPGFSHCQIYDALARFEVTESWEMIAAASMSEASQWDRLCAVKALSKMKPDSTAPYLIPLLNSESKWIRSNAVAVANELNDERLIPPLKQLLDDDYFEVRFLARNALDRIESQ